MDEFVWGNIVRVHEISNFKIVEYVSKIDNETNFHVYVDDEDTHYSEDSLDRALSFALAYKYDDAKDNTRAHIYFNRMIGL